MERKDPFKLGINVGLLRGQKMYGTDIEHPEHAIHEANKFIHEKFDDRFSIYFIDENNRGRRRSRRRE